MKNEIILHLADGWDRCANKPKEDPRAPRLSLRRQAQIFRQARMEPGDEATTRIENI